MPVLHMSRCCVLRRLILRLQPGRALNHDVPRAPDRNNSAQGWWTAMLTFQILGLCLG